MLLFYHIQKVSFLILLSFIFLSAIHAQNNPTGTNEVITISEDIAHAFATGDFLNYADLDGHNLTNLQIATTPTAGTITSLGLPIVLNSNYALGDLSYTSVENEFGDAYATFTFRLVDSNGEVSAVAYTMTVNVTPVNDAPIITGQEVLSTDEETDLLITISDVHFTDVDNTITSTSHTLIIQDGTGYSHVGNTITPNADVTTPITVNAVVSDQQSVHNLSTSYGLTVSVNGINDAPVITGQEILSTDEETDLLITISDIHFTDVDNAITGSSHILFIQDGTGYSHAGNTITPDVDVTTSITVNAVVSDQQSVHNLSTPYGLTVSINGINDAPVITGQNTVSTAEETLKNIVFTDLLVSDVDDSYPTDFSINISVGTDYVVVDNSITPNLNVVGDITVPVSVTDPHGASSNVWNLVVSVVNDNDPPIVTDISNQTIDEGAQFTDIDLNIYVTDPDNSDNQITWTAVGQTDLIVTIDPVSKIAQITAPNVNWFGTETVRFIASDGTLTSEDAVAFTINPVNDLPVINGQSSLSTNEDESFVIPLTSLTVVDVDNSYPSEHTLTVLSGTDYSVGNNIITPAQDFNGVLTIPVVVNDFDQVNTSNTFNVSVTVNALNDAPIISGLTNALSINEDESISVNLSNFMVSDIDNSAEDFSLSLYDGDNYSISNHTIIPDANFYGTLSVEASVSDGGLINGMSSRFAFAVLVISQNDSPQADDFSITIAENQPIVIDMNSHVLDVDGSDIFSLNISTLKITSDVTNGITSVNTVNGNITYTPNVGFSGLDTFTYEVCDNNNACSSGVVTITVSNEAPTANEDVVSLNEDTEGVFSVLANDVDPQSNIDVNSLKIITQPLNGSATVLADGSISYAANQNFNGEDQLTYEVCDEDGYCASALVNIAINSVNDQPVILSQQELSMFEDNSETLNLNHLSVSDVDNVYPNDFVLSVQSGENYTIVGNTITPNLNFSGELIIHVAVNDQGDENNLSDVFGFVLDVLPINDNPVINDQVTLTTNEDVPLTINVTDLTITDPDNMFPDDFVLVVLPGLNYSSTGTTIVPDLNYYGDLNLPIYISDQQSENDRSKIYNLIVQVDAVNDAPVTNPINQSTPEDVTVEIAMVNMVSDVDGNIDYNTFENVNTPQSGVLTHDDVNHTVTYSPNTGFSGEDSFNYRFYDEEDAVSNISTVTISVTNEAPNAIDDEIEIDEDEVTVFNVIENDIDPQDNIDLSTLIIVSNPQNGLATVNTSTGEITYTPSPDFYGTDNLTYRICDASGYCDEASVQITIHSVNDNPVTLSDEAETMEDESVSIDVLVNDSDIDSDVNSFEIAVFSQPENGNVTIDSNSKECLYTPAENYNGTDEFEYQVCDLEGGCIVETVSVVVSPQNDTPLTSDDLGETSQEIPVSIPVADNDMDIDGNLDITSVKMVTHPQNGDSKVESLTGNILYTPNVGFSGQDSFVYSICDTNGACANATVTVYVSAKKSAPICVSDTIHLTDGETVSFNVLDNDIDVDGDEITIVIDEANDLNGVLTDEEENGQFSYVSVFGAYCIQELLNYKCCDEFGSCGSASVVFVIGVNDTDNDKISNFLEEQHFNTDGDEFPDYDDLDSDNDGIEDALEGGIESICTQEVADTDEDGIPDYRDLDSDNDGVPDLEEGNEDCDNDGIPNYRDDFDDCAERIDAPETFSPNGDGVNDFFIIPGINDFESNEIFVYNRWGGEVFHMKNYDNSWGGKSANSAIGSSELPQGTYFYVVKLGGTNKVIKGTVYIKR